MGSMRGPWVWAFPCFSCIFLSSCLARPVLSTFTLVSYPDGIIWTEIGEWIIVSDRKQTWTSFSMEGLFKERVSHRTTKLQECQELVRLQELQDQGASSSGIPSFFHASYFLRSALFSLTVASFVCWRKIWTLTVSEAFYFMALAASEAINQTLVLNPNIPGRNSPVPEPVSWLAMSHKTTGVSERPVGIEHCQRKRRYW